MEIEPETKTRGVIREFLQNYFSKEKAQNKEVQPITLRIIKDIQQRHPEYNDLEAMQEMLQVETELEKNFGQPTPLIPFIKTSDYLQLRAYIKTISTAFTVGVLAVGMQIILRREMKIYYYVAQLPLSLMMVLFTGSAIYYNRSTVEIFRKLEKTDTQTVQKILKEEY